MPSAAGIIDAIAAIGLPTLYLVAFGLALAETVLLADIVIPGEIGLLVTAAATSRSDGSIGLLIVAGVSGAIIGDSISYAIGRRWGTDVVCHWSWTERHLGPKLRKAQRFYDERGGLTVALGRWVGALRAVVPVVVGTAGMQFRRFLPWNVAGSVTWAPTVIAIGWFLGRQVEDTVRLVGTGISVVVVGVLLTWGTMRWLRSPHDG